MVFGLAGGIFYLDFYIFYKDFLSAWANSSTRGWGVLDRVLDIRVSRQHLQNDAVEKTNFRDNDTDG